MTKLNRFMLAGIFLSLTSIIFTPLARGQIFMVNGYDYSVRQFTFSGSGSVFVPVSTGLLSPTGLAFDPAGYLYVADNGHHRIDKFASDGSYTIFGSLDPVSVSGLAFSGNNLYVASYGNSKIFKFDQNGNRSDFITGFNGISAITFDSTGNLFVADGYSNTVVKITQAGNSSIFADASDGLNAPVDLAFKAGILYVVNFNSNTILKFDSNGNGSVFANTFVDQAVSLAFDGVGNLYVVNNGNDSIGRNFIAKYDSNGNGSYFNTNFLGIGFIAIQSGCAPGVMSIAEYAGVTVSGSIGCTYRVDYTTDLNNPTWIPLVTNTLLSSPFLFIDTNVVSGSRFYRAITQ